jgi:Fe-S cluster assembly iron-binding protein IscA
MVQLTERAIEQLEVMRDQSNIQTESGVAIVANERGELSLAVAQPQAEDEVIERDGKTVLIVPRPLIEPLASTTIDFVESSEVQGFTLSQAD